MNDEQEKLMPCPFRGEVAYLPGGTEDNRACYGFCSGTYEGSFSVDRWNSAYAWTLVKELAGALERISSNCTEPVKNHCACDVAKEALAKVPKELRT